MTKKSGKKNLEETGSDTVAQEAEVEAVDGSFLSANELRVNSESADMDAESSEREKFQSAEKLLAAESDIAAASEQGSETGEILEPSETAPDSEDYVEQGGEAGPDVPLISSLSALLFVATRPLTTTVLSKAARASKEEVVEALQKLKEVLVNESLGIVLTEVAGGYQLRSAPQLSVVVKRLIRQKDRRLSRAAAETLAVVAYKQPVGRAEIEAIRGVDALPTIKTLLDSKLIRIVGRDTSVGHPALFGTTEKFLERFGLADLSELVSMKEVEQLVREPGEGEAEEAEPQSASFDEAQNTETPSELGDEAVPDLEASVNEFEGEIASGSPAADSSIADSAVADSAVH
jgi:segregation and condensation protein B